MLSGFYKALNVEMEERQSVSLLLVQSIFLGIFYGAFDVGAMALFLETYDSSMLGRAFMVSGLAGITLTSLYSFFQHRINFKILSIGNLLMVAVLTALLRIGFGLIPDRILVFAVFILMGPLNIVAMLGFWGTAGRIFTLRQGKRLFGLIDTGQVIGVIISSFSIPLLVTLGFKTRDTLLISALSIILAVVFQVIVSRRVPHSPAHQETREAENKEKANFWKLLHNRYIFLMSAFVVLAMLTAFLIHYSFLSVTDAQYPNPSNLTQFLGLFTGSMMIFIVLIKTFVYARLMKTYGLQLSLVLSGILLGMFTLAAVLVGSIFGYTTTAANFLIFFLVIALSKLFSRSLKDSIEAPSFKLLYQSLDAEIRYDVQARIDGTVNEIAATTSGLIIMVLGALPFLKLIHYSWVSLAIILLWIYVGFILYREYKESLKSSLAKAKIKHSASMKETASIPSGFEMLAMQKDPRAMKALEMLRKLEPVTYEQIVVRMIDSNDPHLRKEAIRQAGTYGVIDPAAEILKKISTDTDNDEPATLLIDRLERKIQYTGSEEHVTALAHSKLPEDRMLAASLAASSTNRDIKKQLVVLLRDHSESVVLSAIRYTGIDRYLDATPYMLDLLSAGKYVPEIFHALADMGEGVLDPMEQVYYKSQTDLHTRIRLVRLYGIIGGTRAVNILLNKLTEANPDLLLQVITSLRKLQVSADEDHQNKIFQVVEQLVENTAWCLAALSGIQEVRVEWPVEKALQEEIKHKYDLLFILLSLVYDPDSVRHVRENLESGTIEGAGYAMELLDLFLAEQLKPILFPLLEDVSIDEKISRLQNFYPIGKKGVKETLLSLINRDYNLVSHWTKASALETYSMLEEVDITEDIIAQAFNPNEMLRQQAARLIMEHKPELFEALEKRILDHGTRAQALLIQSTLVHERFPVYDRICALMELPCFEGVPGIHMVALGNAFSSYNWEDEGELDLTHPAYLLLSGSIKVRGENNTSLEYTSNKLIMSWDLASTEKPVFEFQPGTCLFVLYRETWDELLLDEEILAEKLLALAKKISENQVFTKP